MEALTTILRSIRLDSTLLSRAHLAPPFAIESAGMPSAIFHAVVDGECWIHLSGSEGHHLEAGDVAIVGADKRHVIAAPADRPPVPLAKLGHVNTASGVPLIELGESRSPTRILCGTIEFEHPAAAGFVELLPGLLPLRAEPGPGAEWLRTTLVMLERELDSAEPGATAITTRLVDAVVAMAIRDASVDGVGAGWLAAARDPHIGRAIALIHKRPERDWTTGELAAEVGLSRTRLFELFGKLVGDTPARYLARWRAQCAADLMRQPALSLVEIAERVGYSSEDALTRAFKRVMGTTAASFRRSLAAQ